MDDITLHNDLRILRIELQKAGYSDIESDIIVKGFGADMVAKFPEGSWKTINGARVFVHGGKVVAGLGGFSGKIEDAFKEKKSESKSDKKAVKTETPKPTKPENIHITSKEHLKQLIKDRVDLSSATIDTNTRKSLEQEHTNLRGAEVHLAKEIRKEKEAELKLSPDQEKFASENKQAIKDRIKKNTGRTPVELLDDDFLGYSYETAKKQAVEELMNESKPEKTETNDLRSRVEKVAKENIDHFRESLQAELKDPKETKKRKKEIETSLAKSDSQLIKEYTDLYTTEIEEINERRPDSQFNPDKNYVKDIKDSAGLAILKNLKKRMNLESGQVNYLAYKSGDEGTVGVIRSYSFLSEGLMEYPDSADNTKKQAKANKEFSDFQTKQGYDNPKEKDKYGKPMENEPRSDDSHLLR